VSQSQEPHVVLRHRLASGYSLALMRAGVTLLMLVLLLPALGRAQTNAPDPSAAEPEPVLSLAVAPLQQEMFHRAPTDDRNRELMNRYYESVRLWGAVVRQRFQAVPGKPGCAYYGDGGNLENDIRPLAYAALVNAFLAISEPPAGGLGAKARRQAAEDSLRVLRYLVQGHVTGAGACQNGKRWGDHWQSAFWARSAVLAGWLIWNELAPDLRKSLCRVLAHEADRFLRQKPKSSLENDTGAEENAWNAQLLSLACRMMPSHPHAAQ
jgi:hypothetical protein